jgi:ribonuclease P protein component
VPHGSNIGPDQLTFPQGQSYKRGLFRRLRPRPVGACRYSSDFARTLAHADAGADAQTTKSMTDETHLPAFQTRAQTAPWFPCPSGHQGRSQGSGGTPRPWSQAPERLISRLGGAHLAEKGVHRSPFPGTAHRSGSPDLDRLNRRADYLAARSGQRAHCAPFVIQARARGDDAPARIGITVTRKIGGAVIRNRIKRRLKHAISDSEGLGFRPGYDYVVIARVLAASAPFAALTSALKSGLKKVHARASAQ